jgi:selenocysteine-specific elongation factor
MKNIIVGTAGHIDHGKTSLVKALTGIDTDRLEEEKRRGITIDLGFAHLQLTPSIRVGFVDVPGHERFVKNMLAGVGGIDLVLLVIAADESIKPQTREHFDICRLLGIRQGVVALTKADLVDSDLSDLARLEAEEFVGGSFLEGAPIVPVSATTGLGLAELREALALAADRVAPRDSSGPARLPIDRAFTLHGFGTVVTGTLVSGSIAREDELVLLPVGRRVRVRGVQVHGSQSQNALAGMRTALNVPDLSLDDVRRGMVLASPERFPVTRAFDASVEMLPSAPPLKHKAPVHLHAGTAEIEASVRLVAGDALKPGSHGFARIALEEPIVLAPGDRFILRRFSPVTTIAGGSVIDAQPPGGRLRKSGERLNVLSGSDLAVKAALLVRESRAGLSAAELSSRLLAERAQIIGAARNAGLSVLDPPGWISTREWNQQRRTELVRAVRQFHQEHALEAGMARHDLRAAVMPDAPAFLFDAVLAGTAELVSEKDRVRHRTHRVVLSQQEEKGRETIETLFRDAGLTAPSVLEVVQRSGLDPTRARPVLQMLVKEGALVRVDEELYLHRTAVDQLRAVLNAHKPAEFTVSTFKEWTGISRKYAVPLLEYCDRIHLTRRNGDRRIAI